MSAVLLMIPVLWDVTACLLVNNCRYFKALALPNFEVLQPEKLLFSTLLDRENRSNTLLRYFATLPVNTAQRATRLASSVILVLKF
jgi:hypothetical protein